MVGIVTNYDLLAQFHEVLQPRGYIEIGVRYGDSFRLASCPAIGIDPNPQLQYQLKAKQQIVTMTSYEYFREHDPLNHLDDLDLAYIDGMHRIENVIEDLLHIEWSSHPRTVVVLDDVLPYSAAIAGREQVEGDWTGDVWKIVPLMETFRHDLMWWLVDTQPTGALVVTNLGRHSISDRSRELYSSLPKLLQEFTKDADPPGHVINRIGAVPSSEIVDQVVRYLNSMEIAEERV